MVRKRSRRAQRDQPFADWSYDNIISLLSWLDFSLKHKEINFQATIVDHLKGAFTLKQIEGKLKRLWSNHGPDQVPGTAKLKPDIKTRGSVAIPKYLTEATTENIRLAIKALEKGYVASFSTPPNRRLRSISRLDATPPIQESRLTTPTVPKAGTPQHQKRKFDSVSTTTFGVTPEIGHVHSSFSNTSKSRKKQKTYSKRDRNRSFRATARSPATSLPKQLPGARARDRRSSTLVKDSEDDTSDILDGESDGGDHIREISIPTTPLETQHFDTSLPPDGKTDEVHDGDIVRCICGATEAVHGDGKELIECSHCKSWQHTECIKYFCHQCIDGPQQPATEPVLRHIGSQTDSSTETERESDPRLQSAILTIQGLQESLNKRERELQESQQLAEELNRDMHYMEMARKARAEQYGKPIEVQLMHHQKQVRDLHNELNARSRLGTFTALSSAARHHGATKDLKRGFEDIYSKSRQVFHRLDLDVFPFIPPVNHHTDLLALAQRVFEDGRNDSLLPPDIELSNFDPIVLIRALTSAALQEWVFESDFPKFDTELSVILAAYRDLLANQDGAIALRNLDLATLESLIRKPSFQTSILPKEAQNLAVRLSQTLAPFFTPATKVPDELSWDRFATWGHPFEIWKERQADLVEMFTHALSTKADSCLNIENYEMIIYAPGTKFNSNTMRVETMEGAEDAFNDHEGKVVQICVEAALFAYARNPVLDDASVSDSIISTKNFLRENESQRGEVMPRVKAVVVLAKT